MFKKALYNIKIRSAALLGLFIFFSILSITAYKIVYTLSYDEQSNIAHHIIFNLTGGATIDDLEKQHLLPTTVDGIFSRQPYVFVLDSDGNTLLNTATFGENIPTIPKKFLAKADWVASRYVWQPERGVRQGIIVMSYTTQDGNSKGYVVVGRDLMGTDENYLEILSFIVKIWLLVTVIVIIYPVSKKTSFSKLSTKK